MNTPTARTERVTRRSASASDDFRRRRELAEAERAERRFDQFRADAMLHGVRR